MIEVFQLGVAAWMVYETVRAVTTVPAWLQPILVMAVIYGLTWCPPIVLTVLCAAAVCACLRMLVAVTARPQMVGYRENGPKRQRIPKLP